MTQTLITARSNFQQEQLDKPGNCSGCGRKYLAGEQAYVKRWQSTHNRKQICRTILCNLEECWETWDESIFPVSSPAFDRTESDHARDQTS